MQVMQWMNIQIYIYMNVAQKARAFVFVRFFGFCSNASWPQVLYSWEAEFISSLFPLEMVPPL